MDFPVPTQCYATRTVPQGRGEKTRSINQLDRFRCAASTLPAQCRGLVQLLRKTTESELWQQQYSPRRLSNFICGVCRGGWNSEGVVERQQQTSELSWWRHLSFRPKCFSRWRLESADLCNIRMLPNISGYSCSLPLAVSSEFVVVDARVFTRAHSYTRIFVHQ
jgi:hypothetical protein